MAGLFNLLTSFKGDGGPLMGAQKGLNASLSDSKSSAFGAVLSDQMSQTSADRGMLQPAENNMFSRLLSGNSGQQEWSENGLPGTLPTLAEQVNQGELTLETLPPGIAALVSQFLAAKEASQSGEGLTGGKTLPGTRDGFLTDFEPTTDPITSGNETSKALRGQPLPVGADTVADPEAEQIVEMLNRLIRDRDMALGIRSGASEDHSLQSTALTEGTPEARDVAALPASGDGEAAPGANIGERSQSGAATGASIHAGEAADTVQTSLGWLGAGSAEHFAGENAAVEGGKASSLNSATARATAEDSGQKSSGIERISPDTFAADEMAAPKAATGSVVAVDQQADAPAPAQPGGSQRSEINIAPELETLNGQGAAVSEIDRSIAELTEQTISAGKPIPDNGASSAAPIELAALTSGAAVPGAVKDHQPAGAGGRHRQGEPRLSSVAEASALRRDIYPGADRPAEPGARAQSSMQSGTENGGGAEGDTPPSAQGSAQLLPETARAAARDALLAERGAGRAASMIDLPATAAERATFVPVSGGAAQASVQAPLQAPHTRTDGAPLAPWMQAFSMAQSPDAMAADMRQRIVWMNSATMQSADIQLDPPELGPMQVQVRSHSDGSTSVHFSAQHAVVRDALEASLPRLREMLESSGMNLVDVNVSHQQGGGPRDDRDGGRNGSGQGDLVTDGDVEGLEHLRTEVVDSVLGVVDLHA